MNIVAVLDVVKKLFDMAGKKAVSSAQEFTKNNKVYREKYQNLSKAELLDKYQDANIFAEKSAIASLLKEKGWKPSDEN